MTFLTAQTVNKRWIRCFVALLFIPSSYEIFFHSFVRYLSSRENRSFGKFIEMSSPTDNNNIKQTKNYFAANSAEGRYHRCDVPKDRVLFSVQMLRALIVAGTVINLRVLFMPVSRSCTSWLSPSYSSSFDIALAFSLFILMYWSLRTSCLTIKDRYHHSLHAHLELINIYNLLMCVAVKSHVQL